MLTELHIRNLAIIEQVDLTFGAGFNVLTGETGAGKSILIDAIGLVLGERADPTLIRTGADRTLVSAVFDLSSLSASHPLLTEGEFQPEEGLIYLTRELQASGRSIARLNGQPVPLAALKKAGELLVDLHGQHEHQSLLYPASHLEFLDRWLGNEVLEWRAQVRDLVLEVNALRRELEEIRTRERERAHLIDLYRFQIEEIRNAKLQVGEEEALTQEERRLAHAEKLLEQASRGYAALMEEGGAYDRLATALQAVEEIARIDSTLHPLQEQLQNALILAQEASQTLREYGEQVEFNPARLEGIGARLDLIRRLKRKYGDSLEAILAYQAEIEQKLEALERQEERRVEVESRLQALEEDLRAAAEHLSAARHKGAQAFSQAVEAELRALAMERASFKVQLQPKPVDTTGTDAVEFLLAPNPGEALRPLAKIASGGELSRVMLALKTVLADASPVPSLIFDEIDIGLGGRTAGVVGEKMRQLAERYQILGVTHLPQIACRAHHHFLVEKNVVQGRTVVQVRHLDKEERVREIARMLAGEAGETALQHARELLREVQK